MVRMGRKGGGGVNLEPSMPREGRQATCGPVGEGGGGWSDVGSEGGL